MNEIQIEIQGKILHVVSEKLKSLGHKDAKFIDELNSMFEDMEEQDITDKKGCDNCRHLGSLVPFPPCRICLVFSNWESIDNDL